MPNNEDLPFFSSLSCKAASTHNGCTHATEIIWTLSPLPRPVDLRRYRPMRARQTHQIETALDERFAFAPVRRRRRQRCATHRRTRRNAWGLRNERRR
jgi:hypothetical protein